MLEILKWTLVCSVVASTLAAAMAIYVNWPVKSGRRNSQPLLAKQLKQHFTELEHTPVPPRLEVTLEALDEAEEMKTWAGEHRAGKKAPAAETKDIEQSVRA